MKSILMVHGITDTGKVFNSMRNHFDNLGYYTDTIDLIPNFGTADLRDLARQLKQYIDIKFSDEKKIILLGFSMGGLVTRYYLQRLNGMEKIDKYISISAPNNGTNNAHFLPLKGIQQMRPHSKFLTDINSDIKEKLKNIPSLFLWTPFDAMIMPADSSIIGIGTEICLPILVHKWMLSDRRVFQEIENFLNHPH